MMVTLERFTEMVETPLKWANDRNCDRNFIKSIIARTMRLTLADPELAREYYNKLPMATMDTLIATENT